MEGPVWVSATLIDEGGGSCGNPNKGLNGGEDKVDICTSNGAAGTSPAVFWLTEPSGWSIGAL